MAGRTMAEIDFEYDALVTAVQEKIKDLILNQFLEPGAKIKQEELAKTLGVSRTPIIKALHLLVVDNLVTYTPRKGFSVKVLNTREMAEVFYVRELLDGAAAREVARKATPDDLAELAGYFTGFGSKWDRDTRARYMANDRCFHLRMHEIAAVPLLQKINEMFNIARVSYQRGLLRDPNETLVEHLDIIEAIRCRDEEAAERLARLHSVRSRAVLLKALEHEK